VHLLLIHIRHYNIIGSNTQGKISKADVEQSESNTGGNKKKHPTIINKSIFPLNNALKTLSLLKQVINITSRNKNKHNRSEMVAVLPTVYIQGTKIM
jgi:hypothetical protein